MKKIVSKFQLRLRILMIICLLLMSYSLDIIMWYFWYALCPYICPCSAAQICNPLGKGQWIMSLWQNCESVIAGYLLGIYIYVSGVLHTGKLSILYYISGEMAASPCCVCNYNINTYVYIYTYSYLSQTDLLKYKRNCKIFPWLSLAVLSKT